MRRFTLLHCFRNRRRDEFAWPTHLEKNNTKAWCDVIETNLSFLFLTTMVWEELNAGLAKISQDGKWIQDSSAKTASDFSKFIEIQSNTSQGAPINFYGHLSRFGRFLLISCESRDKRSSVRQFEGIYKTMNCRKFVNSGSSAACVHVQQIVSMTLVWLCLKCMIYRATCLELAYF